MMVRFRNSKRSAFRRGSAVLVCLSMMGLFSALSTGTTQAATGANFIATGHDMDYHCAGGSASSCSYLKIAVDKARNGSTLPILLLDQGTELPTALAAAGYAGASYTTVDPSNTVAFNATPFVTSGSPNYSAIVTASDSTCGGCDNTPAGESNINARSSDFTAFFNAGGGIVALSGAGNRATYYNFVPLAGLTATAVSQPFTVTSAGATLGITSTMANCCATHNSFTTPPSPFAVLETDSVSNAETIAVFNGTIGGGGFGGGDCPGDLKATVSGTQGTAGNDVIIGTSGNDVIHAGAGNDIICGLGGNDTIYGESGNDTIYGGSGKDVLYAGSGDDKVYGGSGVDKSYGESGNDTIVDTDGTPGDLLSGDGGTDHCQSDPTGDTKQFCES